MNRYLVSCHPNVSPALTQELDPASVQEVGQPHLEVGEDLALAGQV